MVGESGCGNTCSKRRSVRSAKSSSLDLSSQDVTSWLPWPFDRGFAQAEGFTAVFEDDDWVSGGAGGGGGGAECERATMSLFCRDWLSASAVSRDFSRELILLFKVLISRSFCWISLRSDLVSGTCC